MLENLSSFLQNVPLKIANTIFRFCLPPVEFVCWMFYCATNVLTHSNYISPIHTISANLKPGASHMWESFEGKILSLHMLSAFQGAFIILVSAFLHTSVINLSLTLLASFIAAIPPSPVVIQDSADVLLKDYITPRPCVGTPKGLWGVFAAPCLEARSSGLFISQFPHLWLHAWLAATTKMAK